MPSLKVTNPEDPRFDPEAFDFYDYYINNYKYYEKTCEAVKKVIHLGMSQKVVENILIESGNAYKVLNNEYRRSYLNPVEIGRYIPMIIYSKNYQAQIFVIQYTNEKTVKDETICLKITGPMARNTYESARKRGKYNGTDIYR